MTGFQILIALLFALLTPTLYQVIKLISVQKRQHADVLTVIGRLQRESERAQAVTEELRKTVASMKTPEAG